jgi:predicted phage baseplate assembly protein
VNGAAGAGAGSQVPPGLGAVPYRLGSRPQFLAAMLAELFAAQDTQGHPFGLRTTELDDPTVALLDAWATVADVISFYQERIANEGFKRTAVQPESVIALSRLVGKAPRPGLAASVYLAYSLSPDPADTAVRLSAGLQAQTVPGPGELPQMFETAMELLARPSWNSLGLRNAAPLSVTRQNLPLLDQIAVDGVSTHLSANDVVLLDFSDGDPGLLRVAQARPSTASGQTLVRLRVDQRQALNLTGAALLQVVKGSKVPPGPFQPAIESQLQTLESAASDAAAAGQGGAAKTAQTLLAALAEAGRQLPDWAELTSVRGDATTASYARRLLADLTAAAPGAAALAATDPDQGIPQPPARRASTDIWSAITLLAGPLAQRAPVLPASAPVLKRRIGEVYGTGTDATIRLLLGLRPEIAGSLYPALAGTTVQTPTVRSASALRVKAAPFGTQVPPRVISSDPGRPPRTEEWPVGQASLLTLTVPVALGRHELDWAQLHAALAGQQLQLQVEAPAGQSQRSLQRPGPGSHPTPVRFGADLGEAAVALDQDSLTLVYTGIPDAAFRLEISGPAAIGEAEYGSQASATAGIVFLVEGAEITWDPEILTPLRATVGGRRLSVAWSLPPPGSPGGAVTVSVETPLPLGEAGVRVLTLDRVYDTILAGTWVVIEQAPASAPRASAGAAAGQASAGHAAAGPAIARVTAVREVVVQRYGVSGRATRLELDRPWTSPDIRLLSQIRDVVIRAQPDVLSLRPVAVTADIAGDQLELDRVYAGLEAGRQVIVSGTRADLPAGTCVQAAEVATVKNVSQGVDTGIPGDVPHTTLALAAPLSYRYRRGSATVLGNVVAALHGQTQQQVLGSGLAGQAGQAFTLSMAPVLATARITKEGSSSSLAVTVDGQPWHEVDRVGGVIPARSYLTGSDAAGHVTVMFPGQLPAGSGNVSATYRVGQGSLGNVPAHKITQLVSRPLGVSGVDNPLPAAGGTDGDSPQTLRASTSTGLGSLGRLVTITDYADNAASWAGVAKAAAVTLADGSGGRVVHITVAGPDAAPLDPAGGLCAALQAGLGAAGDPEVPLLVAPAELALIVVGGTVRHDPAASWLTVSANLRAALLDAFGYPRRDLGQDVVLSELLATAQAVAGVRSVTVEALTVVPAWYTAAELARLDLTGPVPSVIEVPGARLEERTATTLAGETLSEFAARYGVQVSQLLRANPAVSTVVFGKPTCLALTSGLQPARLAYLPASVPDALVLREATS